jgi:DNA invertase Pin-like site-specific DNA recombinase
MIKERLGMLIGYIRVSKSDGSQLLDLQRDALEAAGVATDRIYEDLASGRKDDRPGLVACMKALQPDNTLVIWKLDRLGRDLKHLVNIVDDLNHRGIGLKALAGAGARSIPQRPTASWCSEFLRHWLSSRPN